MRRFVPTIAVLAIAPSFLAGCISDQSRQPAPVLYSTNGRTFGQAGLTFAQRGPQPGSHIPAMWLVGLDGQEKTIDDVRGNKPMVLVTASITSNVTRRREQDLAALQARWGDRVAFVTVYTLEAHPKGDASPYSGTEWVPEQNVADEVLVRQPTTLTDRMILAREFDTRFGGGSIVLVDPMDDIAWRTLGMAPNLGLLLDSDGVIRLRQGWFEPGAMDAGLEAMLGTAPAAPAAVASE